MRVSDLLIIYFSLGAPVAVHFYLQHRARESRAQIWRATAFTFLFWMPAATRFLFASERLKKAFLKRSRQLPTTARKRDEDLHRLQKRLENVLRASGAGDSIFEFRETVERYIGLTLARKTKDGEGNERFFLAARSENPALAAKCFERRNRSRLSFHQTAAQRDFLQVLVSMSERDSDEREIKLCAREFAKITGDFEFESAVEKMFNDAPPPPSKKESTDLLTEKNLWTPTGRQRPQLATNSILRFTRNSARTAATAATRSPEKD